MARYSSSRAPIRRPQATRRASLGKMKILLLITIAIVLAKVVVPPLTRTMLARKLEAPIDRSAMKALELAIQAYRLEQFQLPIEPEWKDEGLSHATQGAWLEALLGKTGLLNPKGTAYLTVPSAPTQRGGIYTDARGHARLVDQYGRPFQVLFDLDGDGRIANPDPAAPADQKLLPATVLIFSLGADGLAVAWKDNLRSW
jgi:type II secretory pathway pseudopilin PulG